MRGTPRNIQVYNPTTNSLNVQWEAAPGPVQQYKVVYKPLAATRPSESVSNLIQLFLKRSLVDEKEIMHPIPL